MGNTVGSVIPMGTTSVSEDEAHTRHIRDSVRAARGNSRGQQAGTALMLANHHDYKNERGESVRPDSNNQLASAYQLASSLPPSPVRYASSPNSTLRHDSVIAAAHHSSQASPFRYDRGSGRFQCDSTGTIYHERLLHPDSLKQMKVGRLGLIRHPFATDEDEDEVRDLGVFDPNLETDDLLRDDDDLDVCQPVR